MIFLRKEKQTAFINRWMNRFVDFVMDFHKDITRSKTLLKQAEMQILNLEKIISSNHIDASFYTKILEYEDTTEKLTNTARLMPVLTGNPHAKQDIKINILENQPVSIDISGDFPRIILPCLLPRKEKGNASFIRNTLNAGFQEYIQQHGPLTRISENIVFVVHHVYSPEREERRYRDHDNIELNVVVDIVTLYLLVDDSPIRCKHFYYSSSGETDHTEILLIPEDKFPDYILHHVYHQK